MKIDLEKAQEEFIKYPICHFGKLTMKEDKPNG